MSWSDSAFQDKTGSELNPSGGATTQRYQGYESQKSCRTPVLLKRTVVTVRSAAAEAPLDVDTTDATSSISAELSRTGRRNLPLKDIGEIVD
jgi:hypothetical protein